MTTLRAVLPALLYLALGFLLARIVLPRDADTHDEYMMTEYPDIMAFTIAEVKIDKFLMDLENKG